MAHHVRIKVTPHTNKDGSTSKTKKDYTVTVRTRGRKKKLGTATSQSKAEDIRMGYFEALENHRKTTGVK